VKRLLLALLLLARGAAADEAAPEPRVVPLRGPVGEAPEGWEPLEFPKIPQHTRYTLVEDNDQLVLRAESRAQASGLVFRLAVDPQELPRIRWRWRVENVLRGGDVTRKEGDDYAARLYILFESQPWRLPFARRLAYRAAQLLYGELPTQSLVYIWASHADRGRIYDNPYADVLKMVVVESGPELVGQWVEEERSIVEDYRRAFGQDPPAIRGIAVMMDTDNTREEAVAYFSDIRLLPPADSTKERAPEASASPQG
jgi:hypothetical protein